MRRILGSEPRARGIAYYEALDGRVRRVDLNTLADEGLDLVRALDWPRISASGDGRWISTWRPDRSRELIEVATGRRRELERGFAK